MKQNWPTLHTDMLSEPTPNIILGPIQIYAMANQNIPGHHADGGFSSEAGVRSWHSVQFTEHPCSRAVLQADTALSK